MIAGARDLLKRPFSKIPFRIRFGIAEGLSILGLSSYVLGLFFKKPLTKEELFIQNLDLKGKTIYDLGGYIGILTLYFAKTVGKSGRVIVYEPNPVNFEKIKNNLSLNGFDHTGLYPIALGAKKGKAKLAFRRSGTATGSLQEHIKTDILNEEKSMVIDVEVDTLDNQIRNNSLAKPDFVKIDVEGMELDVLLGMQETIKKDKPQIYIEIHGNSTARKIDNAEQVIGFLISYGYTVFHVETEQAITTDNAFLAKEGHIWSRYLE
ncbi:MAG: FkbM family methyltransferase [Balneolales bacterium]